MKKKTVIVIMIIILIGLAIGGYFFIRNQVQEGRNYEIEKITNYQYFVVKQEEKKGVINTKGELIVSPQYDDVKIPNPTKPVFICYQGENTKVVNEKGEEILTGYSSVTPLRLKNVSTDLVFEKSVLCYEKDGKFGLVDFTGKELTKPMYEEIQTLQYKEGELLVKQNGKYGVINSRGNQLVEIAYDKIQADGYYSEQDGYKNDGYLVSKTTNDGYRYGYVNQNGKVLLQTEFNELSRITEIEEPDNCYLICAKNGKYGLFKNEVLLMDHEYQSISYNKTNDVMIVQKGKKYGVANRQGKIEIPIRYMQIDVNGMYFYVTNENEETEVYDAKFQITNMSPDLVILPAGENGQYQITIETIEGKISYDLYENGQKLTQAQYHYMEYLANDCFIVSNEQGKLGVIDKQETIKIELQYDSIQKLANTEVIQAGMTSTRLTELYDDKLQKVEQMENAQVEVKDTLIQISNENQIRYFDYQGKELTNTEVFSQNQIFTKEENGKWGFVDRQGNEIVPFEYEQVTEVNCYGFAGIQKEGKWGVIDQTGKQVVDPIYEFRTGELPEFIGPYYQVKYGVGEIYYTK